MINRIAFIAWAVLLCACGSLPPATQRIDAEEKAAVEALSRTASNASNGSVIRTRRQRMAGEEVPVQANALPPAFNERIAYVTRGTQTLSQALEDISVTSGIKIRASEVVEPSTQNSPNREQLSGYISLDFNGTNRDLFDEIAGKTNTSWRYNAGAKVVEFFRFETRFIPIYIPAGAKTVASSISLSGASGGGGGGTSTGGGAGQSSGNVSVTQNMTIDPWKSLMAGIDSILADGRRQGPGPSMPPGAPGGPGGASGGSGDFPAVPSPELGLVTVTARPATMERVLRYIKSVNARFAQNILIDAKIITVTLSEQLSAGFNLNLLYDPINKFGGSIVGPAALAAGTSSPGTLTLRPSAASPFDGSSLVIKALSQYGKIAHVRQAQAIAVNGQPSPMQIADEYNFRGASSLIPQNGTQGPIVAATQNTKVIGFTANFIPLIMGDNRISLSYQIDMSSLTGKTVGPDGSEQPQIATRKLPGNVFLRDGEAVVLFGYGENQDATDGAVHAGGASRAATRARQLTVIVLQVFTGSKNADI